MRSPSSSKCRCSATASAASLTFSGGDVTVPLEVRKLTSGERRHGTRVRVWPDARYFESAELPRAELMHLLRSKAVLMPGVTVSLTIEKAGKEPEALVWTYQGGLRDYLQQTLTAEPVVPLFEGERFAGANESENFAEGEGAAWCVAFTEDGAPMRESYVNLIPTVAGGTHESGLKDGLFTAVKTFIELHGLMPKGVKLMPEDVFSRASFVLSAKVLDPQFQGQIKERLNSRDALRLVSAFTKPGAGAVAAPARGVRPQARRAGDPPGAAAPEGRPEGGEAQGLGRRRAAGQAHRLREPRPVAQRGVPRRRRLGRRLRPSLGATSSTRPSCRCAARC